MILGLYNAIRTGKLRVNGDRESALRKVAASSCVFALVAADDPAATGALHEIHRDLGGVLIIEDDPDVCVM